MPAPREFSPVDTKFVAAGTACAEFDDCVEVVLSFARLPPAESEGEFVGMVLLLIEVLVIMPIPFAIKSPTPGPVCELELLDRGADELLDRKLDELLDRDADELLDRKADELLDVMKVGETVDRVF